MNPTLVGMASPMGTDLLDAPVWDERADAAFRREQGQVIRTLMKLTGVTGRQIADTLGVNESTISNRLSGATPFRAPEIAVVARLLGVDPGVLYRSKSDVLEKISSNRCYLGTSDGLSAEARWALRTGWGGEPDVPSGSTVDRHELVGIGST